MAKADVTRKLTAILCADVVGYSRLMGDDEPGTVQSLTESREVFFTEIKRHNGRVVNAPGDAILAEFTSVVDAVNCAVEIQREIAERNLQVAGEKQMVFRIGINLGDVIVKDKDIYGDGVNISARLESLAEPGGICISGSAFDQVEGKLPLHYEFMGEQKVKNIAKPVRAYHVRSTPGAAAHRVVRAVRGVMRNTRRNWLVLAAMIGLLGLGGWYLGWVGTPGNSAAQEKLPLNSIAVLAFDNLSGDPEQEYFSDAISENILTKLSRLGFLAVIARNSSFFYKGKATDIKQIGRELGALYVLEGSVQKSGKKVRINAQLINAETGEHVWAERYDRDLYDIFVIQDEITSQITQTVFSVFREQIKELGLKRTAGKEAENIQAQDLAWQAYAFHWKALEAPPGENIRLWEKADQLADQALAIEPDLPDALGAKVWANLNIGFFGKSRKNFKIAFQTAMRAREISPHDYRIHLGLGILFFATKKFDKSFAAMERALELNPNSADVMMQAALHNSIRGNPQRALALVEKALRLNPRHPSWYVYRIASTYYFNGMYKEALKALLRQRQTGHAGTLRLFAVTYAKLGKMEQAREKVQELLKYHPKTTVKAWEAGGWLIPPDVVKDYAATLRKAGMPD